MPPPLEVKFRYGVVRIADRTDDQQPASAIVTALSSSITQEDLQIYFLSQMKRIIWGQNTGHWYTDFESLGVLSLAEITGGSSVGRRAVGAALLGPRDGTNRTFTTPSKFVYVPAGETVEVFHNGRRLVQGSPNPSVAEYFVSESGGIGTGFDTVNFVAFSPSPRAVLVANYLPLVP